MRPDPVTQAVAQAIQKAPVPLNILARAAGLPSQALIRVLIGEGPATGFLSHAVERTLERWSATCDQLARNIRKARRQRTQISDDAAQEGSGSATSTIGPSSPKNRL